MASPPEPDANRSHDHRPMQQQVTTQTPVPIPTPAPPITPTLPAEEPHPPLQEVTNVVLNDAPLGPSTSNASTINATPISANPSESEIESTYHLKWVEWNTSRIPIVMQSKNGPCPLIATINVLLLREKIKFPQILEQITAEQLISYLGECIMESAPTPVETPTPIEIDQGPSRLPCEVSVQSDRGISSEELLNVEQNINDAIDILPKFKTGLNVNIRFTGITDFEYTPECVIFDLLRIPLYHGWLVDPGLEDVASSIGSRSYNQLVDFIISNKTSSGIDPAVEVQVMLAEEFLDKTASQLTNYGLDVLKAKIRDNEIGILFRNNHFLTLLKRDGEIFTLVTDHGYLTEEAIVWETLDNIEGVGRFFNSNFVPSELSSKQVSEFQAMNERQKQMENDFLMALSLREEEEQAERDQNRGNESW